MLRHFKFQLIRNEEAFFDLLDVAKTDRNNVKSAFPFQFPAFDDSANKIVDKAVEIEPVVFLPKEEMKGLVRATGSRFFSLLNLKNPPATIGKVYEDLANPLAAKNVMNDLYGDWCFFVYSSPHFSVFV